MKASALIANLHRWIEMHGDSDVVLDKGDELQPVDVVLLAEFDDGVKQIVLANKDFTDELFQRDADRSN